MAASIPRHVIARSESDEAIVRSPSAHNSGLLRSARNDGWRELSSPPLILRLSRHSPRPPPRSAASARERRSRNWCGPCSSSADFGRRLCAGCYRIADRGAADAEAGADDRAGRVHAVTGAARQQRAALRHQRACPQQTNSFTTLQSPASCAGPMNRQESMRPSARQAATIDAAAKVKIFGKVLAGIGAEPAFCQPRKSALSAKQIAVAA